MERFDIYVREKTSDKWSQAKDVTRAVLLAAIDGALSECKQRLRIRIIKHPNQEE